MGPQQLRGAAMIDPNANGIEIAAMLIAIDLVAVVPVAALIYLLLALPRVRRRNFCRQPWRTFSM